MSSNWDTKPDDEFLANASDWASLIASHLGEGAASAELVDGDLKKVVKDEHLRPPAVSATGRSPARKTERPTATTKWHEIPERELTKDLKADIQLLRSRHALDRSKQGARVDLPANLKRLQRGVLLPDKVSAFPQRPRQTTLISEAMRDGQLRRYLRQKVQERAAASYAGSRRWYADLWKKKQRKMFYRTGKILGTRKGNRRG